MFSPTRPRARLHHAVILSLLFGAASVFPARTAVAQTVEDLESRAANGDARAMGELAYRHLDKGRMKPGCAFAREASAKEDPLGDAMHARCLRMSHPSPAQREEARRVARRGADNHNMEAAAEMYLLFTQDPRYQTPKPGIDTERYMRLSQLSIAERSEQIEAYTYLARALKMDNPDAKRSTLVFLMTHAAPDNGSHFLRLLPRSTAPQDPLLGRSYIDLYQLLLRMQAIGGTKMSLKVVSAVTPTAMMMAAVAASTGPGRPCLAPAQLSRVQHGELESPTYLPLPPPLDKAYLVSGSWTDIWDYQSCGKDVSFLVDMKADGWGGVYYRVRLRPAQGQNAGTQDAPT